jgi:hypothetical protein
MTTLQAKELDIVRTQQDAGWIQTITIKAYDKGLITVNGRPIDVTGWAGASAIVAQHVAELAKKVNQSAERAKAPVKAV